MKNRDDRLSCVNRKVSGIENKHKPPSIFAFFALQMCAACKKNGNFSAFTQALKGQGGIQRPGYVVPYLSAGMAYGITVGVLFMGSRPAQATSPFGCLNHYPLTYLSGFWGAPRLDLSIPSFCVKRYNFPGIICCRLSECGVTAPFYQKRKPCLFMYSFHLHNLSYLILRNCYSAWLIRAFPDAMPLHLSLLAGCVILMTFFFVYKSSLAKLLFYKAAYHFTLYVIVLPGLHARRPPQNKGSYRYSYIFHANPV